MESYDAETEGLLEEIYKLEQHLKKATSNQDKFAITSLNVQLEIRRHELRAKGHSIPQSLQQKDQQKEAAQRRRDEHLREKEERRQARRAKRENKEHRKKMGHVQAQHFHKYVINTQGSPPPRTGGGGGRLAAPLQNTQPQSPQQRNGMLDHVTQMIQVERSKRGEDISSRPITALDEDSDFAAARPPTCLIRGQMGNGPFENADRLPGEVWGQRTSTACREKKLRERERERERARSPLKIPTGDGDSSSDASSPSAPSPTSDMESPGSPEEPGRLTTAMARHTGQRCRSTTPLLPQLGAKERPEERPPMSPIDRRRLRINQYEDTNPHAFGNTDRMPGENWGKRAPGTRHGRGESRMGTGGREVRLDTAGMRPPTAEILQLPHTACTSYDWAPPQTASYTYPPQTATLLPCSQCGRAQPPGMFYPTQLAGSPMQRVCGECIRKEKRLATAASRSAASKGPQLDPQLPPPTPAPKVQAFLAEKYSHVGARQPKHAM